MDTKIITVQFIKDFVRENGRVIQAGKTLVCTEEKAAEYEGYIRETEGEKFPVFQTEAQLEDFVEKTKRKK